MNIVACRVDERLVHGQIMASWAKRLQLRRIVIVDDKVAADDFMRTVLALSAPAGVAIDVLTVADAAGRISADAGSENVMLLFKVPGPALELTRALAGTPHEISSLNLGNLGSGPGRTELTRRVFLSAEERDQVRELQGLGVRLYLQMLYTDPAVEVTEAML